MRKLNYYFDTSVFNFIFAEDEPIRKNRTQKLFKNLSELGESFISEVVLREVNNAPEPKRTQLTELIDRYNPKVLDVDEEVENLARRYVEEDIIPVRYHDDARHIAVAVVNDLDVIVSWNFEHIVKLKTRLEINGINKLLGYREIEICSPEEVI